MVAGEIKGNVTADERIELRPSARLLGNMTAPRILIQDGATFEGKVEMKPPAQQGRKGFPAANDETPPKGSGGPDDAGRTSSARRDAGDGKGRGKS